MNRMHFVGAMAITATALTGGCLTRGSRQPIPADPQVTAVRVAAVVEADYTQPVVATGVLAADQETPLAFKVGGVISRMLVTEGTAVRAGQLLAEIDPGEIDAGLARAEAGLAKAARDFERASTLYRDSVISRERLDDAATAKTVAESDLRAVRFNRRYAVIRAPTTGTVLLRMAEPGQLVAAGTPVLMLGAQGQGAIVKVALADRDAARLALGDRAELRFDAVPDRTFAARVTRIGVMAAPGSATYQVEVRLMGPGPWPGRVASGLIAEATITPKSAGAMAMVPLESLLEADGDSATVFALSGDGTRAQRRVVRISGIDGPRAAIRSGLDGVTHVVTDGAAFMKDGAPIRVVTR